MKITLPAPKSCSDCGSDPVHHRQTYLTLLFEILLRPVFVCAQYFGRLLLPGPTIKSREQIRLYDVLHKWHLGEYLEEPDEKTLLLAHILWQEAKARGIHMREFRILGIPTQSFVAEFEDGRWFVFNSIPTLAQMPKPVWWIDNKARSKKKFTALGIPVARGKAVFTKEGSLGVCRTIGWPVIVKPYEGSASRHTTLHIDSEETLLRAFALAKKISPLVMVEEELPGALYRPTLVGGVLIATLRRDPPHVVGDGTHTISELVKKANRHPLRQGPYFSHIKLTKEAEVELERQGLTVLSVPSKGEYVTLHQKINWSIGGTTADVSSKVHPENKKLFENVARILNAHIVGLDILMEDISRPWQEQRAGIIECNGRPYFDNHHLPFKGEPHNVAKVLWDLVEYSPTGELVTA